jgi:hypothetical protein
MPGEVEKSVVAPRRSKETRRSARGSVRELEGGGIFFRDERRRASRPDELWLPHFLRRGGERGRRGRGRLWRCAKQNGKFFARRALDT